MSSNGNPAVNAVAVTPSDSTVYEGNTAIVGFWVNVGGNLVIETPQFTIVTLVVLPGDLVPFRARRVMAATTATVVGAVNP